MSTSSQRPNIIIQRNRPIPIKVSVSSNPNATILPKSKPKGLLKILWQRLPDIPQEIIKKLFYVSSRVYSTSSSNVKTNIDRCSKSIHKKMGIGNSWSHKDIRNLGETSSLFSLILVDCLSYRGDMSNFDIMLEPEVDIGATLEFDYAIGQISYHPKGNHFKLFLLDELKRYSSDNNVYSDIKKTFRKFVEVHNSGVRTTFLLHLHLNEEILAEEKALRVIKAAEVLWSNIEPPIGSKIRVLITRFPYSTFRDDLIELNNILEETIW